MAVTGINPNATLRFRPYDQRHLDIEDQAVYLLKPVDMDAQEQLENDSVRSESKGFKSTTVFTIGTQKKSLILKHLLGWENFNDETGEPVPFEDESPAAKKRTCDWIPMIHRDQIYNALTQNIRSMQTEIDAARELGVPEDQLALFPAEPKKTKKSTKKSTKKDEEVFEEDEEAAFDVV